MYQINGKQFPCHTSVTMGIIGGKWKAAILYYLIEGTLRYSELKKKMEGVTERTLSLQLKRMEQDGVIKKKVYHTKPPLRVEYSLTEFGKTLIPLLRHISEWGVHAVQHHEQAE